MGGCCMGCCMIILLLLFLLPLVSHTQHSSLFQQWDDFIFLKVKARTDAIPVNIAVMISSLIIFFALKITTKYMVLLYIMEINISNYKTYKHIAQDIYNILVANDERIDINTHYALCNYNKLKPKTKQQLNELITNRSNQIINNDTIASKN